MTDIAVVAAARTELGEGPLWLDPEQQLVWLDLKRGTILRLTPSSGELTSHDLGIAIGTIARRRGGGFVLATQRGFATWQWGEAPQWLGDPEAHLHTNRFNDGAVDSHGRLWAATLAEGPEATTAPGGSLYRLDAAGQVRRMDTGFFISNGLAWSPDDRTMYFTDSLPRIIFAYDFDAATGEIANRRPFISVPEAHGLPDGLAVDVEGCLWSACWGAGLLIRYDPQGRVERQVHLPVSYPTSCAFGGPDGRTLYVTSAWTALTPEQHRREPIAGAVLSLEAPARGLVVHAFAE